MSKTIPTSPLSLDTMIGIHGLYFLLPIVTFGVWLTAIIGLLVLWATRDNFSTYTPQNASIVFISDSGAQHRTFFIIFCALTAFFYISTTLVERHLRHQRRIPGAIKRRQTWYDIVSVVCAVIGSLALVFLSVFDARNYSRVHWSMTLVFIVFVALSVLFQVLQVFSLSQSYRHDERWLRYIAAVKGLILALAIAGAIAFAALYGTCRGDANPGDARCDRVISAAAVCEWAIAFLLAIFFLTYIVDLWPAHKRAQHGLSQDGSMVENKSLAAQHGLDNRPTAPYAITGTEADNHNTLYPAPAPAPATATATATTASSPSARVATLNNGSERGSLYQTPMTEARHTPA